MTVLLSKNPVRIYIYIYIVNGIFVFSSTDLLPMCVCIGKGGGSSTKDAYTSTLGGPVPCSGSGMNKRWLLVPVNKAQSAFLGLDLYIAFAGNIFGHFCNGAGRAQCK